MQGHLLRWQDYWFLGIITIPILAIIFWQLYFYPDGEGGDFDSIYGSEIKAGTVFCFSLLAVYYGLYVIVSLVLSKISPTEAAIHLIVWTVAPPVWFTFERYFYFDKRKSDKDLQLLREGQDYSSKFWAAVLAVMLAFKLGDIIKSNKTDSTECVSHAPGAEVCVVSIRPIDSSM